MSDVREAVRERYAAAAKELTAGEPGCCESGSTASFVKDYTKSDLDQLGLTQSVSLGCGNPTLLAELHEGERVLDLGSGGGMDVLLSAKRVGPTGHAFGVDMTDEMLALAQSNREKAGANNATFMKGSIDAIPLPAAAVDVVISNCVINLAEDKGAVIREAFRVLRPGGRLAVADMVQVEELPPDVKKASEMWSGCIAGTIPVEEYRQLLIEAGFAEPEIVVHSIDEIPGGGKIGSAYIRADKPSGPSAL
jgi:arsenite methyltransferase